MFVLKLSLTVHVHMKTDVEPHLLKPFGIVDHTGSASLQGICGRSLQRHSPCLTSPACSAIAQFRWMLSVFF